jgi:hypothetical protein
VLTFELINKKRRPIKIYAISGIATALLILILIGLTGDKLNNSLKIVLMVLSAAGFVTGLFILSYSFRFKRVIGKISFSEKYIEIELLRKKEVIGIESIEAIKFKLAGYDGLNKTMIPLGLYDMSYRSGINNFVMIRAGNETRKFEFYVSNQQDWIDLQGIVSLYQNEQTV